MSNPVSVLETAEGPYGPSITPGTLHTDDLPDARTGALALRLLDDGRELVLYQTLFNLRVVIGPAAAPTYDDGWCFHDPAAAWTAMATWDGTGEPDGFFKRVGDQR